MVHYGWCMFHHSPCEDRHTDTLIAHGWKVWWRFLDLVRWTVEQRAPKRSYNASLDREIWKHIMRKNDGVIWKHDETTAISSICQMGIQLPMFLKSNPLQSSPVHLPCACKKAFAEQKRLARIITCFLKSGWTIVIHQPENSYFLDKRGACLGWFPKSKPTFWCYTVAAWQFQMKWYHRWPQLRLRLCFHFLQRLQRLPTFRSGSATPSQPGLGFPGFQYVPVIQQSLRKQSHLCGRNMRIWCMNMYDMYAVPIKKEGENGEKHNVLILSSHVFPVEVPLAWFSLLVGSYETDLHRSGCQDTESSDLLGLLSSRIPNRLKPVPDSEAMLKMLVLQEWTEVVWQWDFTTQDFTDQILSRGYRHVSQCLVLESNLDERSWTHTCWSVWFMRWLTTMRRIQQFKPNALISNHSNPNLGITIGPNSHVSRRPWACASCASYASCPRKCLECGFPGSSTFNIMGH